MRLWIIVALACVAAPAAAQMPSAASTGDTDRAHDQRVDHKIIAHQERASSKSRVIGPVDSKTYDRRRPKRSNLTH
jgi:hypothetical protein